MVRTIARARGRKQVFTPNPRTVLARMCTRDGASAGDFVHAPSDFNLSS